MEGSQGGVASTWCTLVEGSGVIQGLGRFCDTTACRSLLVWGGDMVACWVCVEVNWFMETVGGEDLFFGGFQLGGFLWDEVA